MSEQPPTQGNEVETREPLLPGIEGPEDLHGLDEEQLQQVAQEMRTYIIDTIGEIGGHFGANLGTCELAVALHSLLDSPRDKVLWDVGHQAYPHKVLTGRRDRLPTIRQYGGLAPFCSIAESEHDIMGAGHASTSVSYAVGLKEAMRNGVGEDGHVVAVIGDGALTGGVAFEALHNAGGMELPLDRGERQRHVDRPQRWGYVPLLQPDPAQPEAPQGPRGRRGVPHPAARRHREADRAPRADPQGVAQGLLGARAVLRGAEPGVRRAGGRPRRGRPARGDRGGARSRPPGGRA